jgi:hypothetical protein
MAASLVTIFIVPCVFCAVEEWRWKRASERELLQSPGSARGLD